MHDFFIVKKERYFHSSYIHQILGVNYSVFQIEFKENFEISEDNKSIISDNSEKTVKSFNLEYFEEKMIVYEIFLKENNKSIFYSSLKSLEIKKKLCIEEKHHYLIQVMLFHDQSGTFVSDVVKINDIEDIKEECGEYTAEFFVSYFDSDVWYYTVYESYENYIEFSCLDYGKIKRYLDSKPLYDDSLSEEEELDKIQKFLENRLLIKKIKDF